MRFTDPALSKIIISFLILLPLFFFLTVIHLSNSGSIQGSTTDLSPSEIIALTNLERRLQGLPQLKENPVLSQAALEKAQHMLENQQFDHTYTVNGKDIQPWQFLENQGYAYSFAGENLGKDFDSAQKLVTAWMESPTHKANILSPKYEEIGVAIVEGSYLDKKNTTLIVQFLATPALTVSQQSPEFQSSPLLEKVATPPNLSLIVVLSTLSSVVLSFVTILGVMAYKDHKAQVSGKLWRS